jgi:chorismate-pyruvate lyase
MIAERVPGKAADQSHIMRDDLQTSLTRSHIDPTTLSTFQRVLLTTDGTVTDILEAYLLEQIRIVKLAEKLILSPVDNRFMDFAAGTEIIDRSVLLQGKISRKNFIYAESVIVPSRLEAAFQRELLETKTPIGKIWMEQRVETFKEIKDSALEASQDLSEYFLISPSDRLLSRTYCVYTNNQAVMMITEKFPETHFL